MSILGSRNKDLIFSDVLLHPLLETFSGFTSAHLQSILGSTPIKGLLAKSVGRKGEISFDLMQSAKQQLIMSIRSHITPISIDPRPHASFIVTAYNFGEPHPEMERGVRLYWGSHLPANSDGKGVNDLLINRIQVLPQKGEEYSSVTEQIGYQRSLQEFPAQEYMHVINLVSYGSGQNFMAVNSKGEVYQMIEVALINGVYEIKVYNDGTVFNSSFQLTIPQHIKIDQRSYPGTVALLK